MNFSEIQTPGRKQAIGLLLAVTLIIADQLSKWAAMEIVLRRASQDGGRSYGFFEWLVSAPERLDFVRVDVFPFFNWVMVWNRGISFGMFQNDTSYAPYIMVALALVISAFFLVWLFRTGKWTIVISTGMIIGGAVGNVIDRLRFGAVADFLDFHAFGYHWPAFNVADTAITLGIALLVIDGLFLAPEKNGEQA